MQSAARRAIAAAGVVTATAASGAVLAQAYPAKPIRFVVPFVAGGPTDIQGRILGQKLAEGFSQQVVIDNRGGAGGNIGMEIVAKSPPDGYTIVISTVGTLAVNPHIYKLSFDVLRDFVPITQVSDSPAMLVVHPSIPARSVKELIAVARARPGQLSFGSSGAGGLGHICGELFKLLAGVDMVHVPYKSSAPALTDVAGGHIAVLFNNMIATVPLVKQGRLRALAVTSVKRSAALPDLPTVAESGLPGYENNSWSGVLVPAGTPREIVTRLNGELVRILRLPDVKEKHDAVGAEVVGSSPEQFAAYLKSETEKLGRIVRQAKIRAE
jgi:tripartite-type tricarboxylate transporter receptor subunit TctC